MTLRTTWEDTSAVAATAAERVGHCQGGEREQENVEVLQQ